jgi:hypothetical protein
LEIAGILEGIADIEAEAYGLLHKLGARPGVTEVQMHGHAVHVCLIPTASVTNSYARIYGAF